VRHPGSPCALTNAFVTIVCVRPRRVPVSRRDRPAKPPLSREGLIAVAWQIMRDEGLERVTMRRLASELDTGPASLYVYVRNTAELHGALLDELLAELDLPGEVPAAQWTEALIELLSAYSGLLMRHPSLARSVLSLQPYGPRYMRLIDTMLGLLRAGDVPVRQAAWGVDLLLQRATAAAAEFGTRGERADAADDFETLATAVAEAPAGDFPHIAHARAELFSGEGRDRIRWAYASMIHGIATTTA
jgi:AcrR family transcriptional regulator